MGMTEHEQRVSRWCEAVFEESKDELERNDEIVAIDRAINYLMGKQWVERRPQYKASPVANRLWSNLTQLVSYLTDIRPVFEIKANNKLYDGHAEVLNKMVRAWFMNEDVDMSIAMIIIHAALTIGYGRLIWNPELKNGEGELELTPLGAMDLIPIRPGHTLQRSLGCIYRCPKPLIWFQEKYPLAGFRVPVDKEYSQFMSGPSQSGMGRWGRAWQVLSPQMMRLFGQSGTQTRDSVIPMALYREFWIRDPQRNTSNSNVWVGNPDREYGYVVPPGQKLYPRGRVIIMGGPIVLYDGPNPHWHGQFPFMCLRINRVPWQFPGVCYSSDTEVLTKRGWLKFSETNSTDEFATRRTSDKKFEWQKAVRTTNQRYIGPMYHFHSKAVSILVTPNHRMLVSKVPRSIGGYNNGGPKKQQRQHEGFITAAELAMHGTAATGIPQTSLWEGSEIGEMVFSCGNTSDKPVKMTGNDYCAFMGAYLSEGWTRSKGGIGREVNISQADKSKGFFPYRNLLRRIMGGEFSYTGTDFVISRTGLARFCRQFGNSHEKYIPQNIMDASLGQLKIFWEYFVLGDGSLKRRPVTRRKIRDGEESLQKISTVSKKLSDQLVEIAQKIGWSASVTTYPAKKTVRKNGKTMNHRVKYEIIVRFSKNMRIRCDEEQYDGTIHCVTVPNGTLYVRRNGKPSWCGNSEFRNQIPLQDVMNNILAGILDTVKKAVNPPLLAPDNAFSTTVKKNLDPNMPNAKVFYSPASMAPPTYANPPILPGFVFQTMLYAQQELDSQSGFLDMTSLSRRGIIPAGDTLEQMKEGQQTLVRLKVRYIEDFMKQMGQQWVPNAFQFQTLKRRVAMLGSDGMTWEDFDYDPGTMVPAGIPAEEHWKAFTFMMQPGSLLKSARESGYPKAFALRRQGDMDLKSFLESIDMGNMYEEIIKNLRAEGADVMLQAIRAKMSASGGGGGLSPSVLQQLSMANEKPPAPTGGVQ